MHGEERIGIKSRQISCLSRCPHLNKLECGKLYRMRDFKTMIVLLTVTVAAIFCSGVWRLQSCGITRWTPQRSYGSYILGLCSSSPTKTEEDTMPFTLSGQLHSPYSTVQVVYIEMLNIQLLYWNGLVFCVYFWLFYTYTQHHICIIVKYKWNFVNMVYISKSCYMYM